MIDIFKLAKRDLNEILSAFEFMDAESMKSVKENLKLENPFKQNVECDFYCLAETHGSCDEHDKAKIEKFYESLNKANLCSDAIISENDTQFKYLWGLRERLAEALKHDGVFINYLIFINENSEKSPIFEISCILEIYFNLILF